MARISFGASLAAVGWRCAMWKKRLRKRWRFRVEDSQALLALLGQWLKQDRQVLQPRNIEQGARQLITEYIRREEVQAMSSQGRVSREMAETVLT